MNSENSGIKTQIGTSSCGNVGKTIVLARVGDMRVVGRWIYGFRLFSRNKCMWVKRVMVCNPVTAYGSGGKLLYSLKCVTTRNWLHVIASQSDVKPQTILRPDYFK